MMVNTPPITSIDDALAIYYGHAELGNKELTALFGKRSSATVARLKRLAKDEMSRREIPSYGINRVNTAVAFEVWGLDVQELEERRDKLKKLEL